MSDTERTVKDLLKLEMQANAIKLSKSDIENRQRAISKQMEDLKLEQRILDEEMAARQSGVRVGEWVNIDGIDYQVDSFYGFWPVLRPLTKKGKLSNNIRHAYRWKEWKAGKQETPW